MYENRFIAFIDLLGFGSLVERSASENELPEKIFSALTSLQPRNIEEEQYASINHELCPPEELESVRDILKIMTQHLKSMSPVTITYFSDSLVISANSEDIIASQLILDILAKLSIKLWSEHALLIRGGITHGKLIHVENGPLFGPAMNRAYYLESKLAKQPRILIDASCLEKYRTVETFSLFESLFENDGEYDYVSLGTAYRHILNDSSLVLAGEAVLGKFRESLAEATNKLVSIKFTMTDESIKSKYLWLIEEVTARQAQINQPY